MSVASYRHPLVGDLCVSYTGPAVYPVSVLKNVTGTFKSIVVLAEAKPSVSGTLCEMIDALSKSSALGPIVPVTSTAYTGSKLDVLIYRSNGPSASVSDFAVPGRQLLGAVVFVKDLCYAAISESPDIVSGPPSPRDTVAY